MQLFYRRPLALVCAVFMAVSLLAFHINFTAQIAAAIVFVAVAVCAVILFFTLKRCTRRARYSGQMLLFTDIPFSFRQA